MVTPEKDAPEERFVTGGSKDLSHGPVLERGCTDIPCIVIFVMHWALFFYVTLMGADRGDPRKLYRPRDFQGSYCGLGPNLGEHKKLLQAMNATAMVEPIVNQVLCSSATAAVLRGVLPEAEYLDYQCDCCLMPCERCSGSLGIPDIASLGDVELAISRTLPRLTNITQGAALFSPVSPEYSFVSAESVFSEVATYFLPVCVDLHGSCELPDNEDKVGHTILTARDYVYSPAPDSRFKAAWDLLSTHPSVPASFRAMLTTQFRFPALPHSVCPYHPRYCVLMPGVNFTEAPGDHCLPRLEGSARIALGASTVSALEDVGASSLLDGAVDSVAGLAQEVLLHLDTLLLTMVWSFVLGLIFMVLLRFLVGCFVWSSLVLVLLAFVVGGILSYVRSDQCVGTDILESGKQMALAAAAAVEKKANDVVADSDCNESMIGDGSDYRGCQSRTRSGRQCQHWDTQGAPHNHTWLPASYPGADLAKNYCRNPANATTIWCMTVSAEKAWEMCSPVGAVSLECLEGYIVEAESERDLLKACAYSAWVFAFIWLVAICCAHTKIKIAIAVSKVAAQFIFHTSRVLLVPIVQIVVALLYSALWLISAVYLLSQVPGSYVSSGSYATWADAVGDGATPGGCHADSFVWRYAGDLAAADDPCSGNMGNTTGMIPRCFRCAPPRYVLDWRVAMSLFSFLWNNALLVAIGQCIVAGAVGVWFFTPNSEKGKHRGSPVSQAVHIAFRYHLGSLAFGSFIIALVQWIRIMLRYLERQAQLSKNQVVVVLMRGLQACMWCFEKCIRFLNRNAYIQIALLGDNFCTSAKNSFFLILRHAARFGSMMVLGSIIQVIGTAVIVVATGLSGFFLLQALHEDASPVVPVLVYLVVGIIVAKLYMSVFGLAMDTALQCFIIAEEQQLDKDCVPVALRKLVPASETSPPSKEDAGDATEVQPHLSRATSGLRPVKLAWSQ